MHAILNISRSASLVFNKDCTTIFKVPFQPRLHHLPGVCTGVQNLHTSGCNTSSQHVHPASQHSHGMTKPSNRYQKMIRSDTYVCKLIISRCKNKRIQTKIYMNLTIYMIHCVQNAYLSYEYIYIRVVHKSTFLNFKVCRAH